MPVSVVTFRAHTFVTLFLGGTLLIGCSGYTGPRSVVNTDPAVKIPEIRKAVDAGDQSVIPQLVQDLDNNDAAVRFYAIQALQRLTGETRGYDWTIADRFARKPAIERWQASLNPQAISTQPEAAP